MYCIMLIEGEESLLQCILPQIIREANKYSYSHPRTQPPRITNYPNKLGGSRSTQRIIIIIKIKKI